MQTTPRFWREIDQRYNLKGAQCGNCNHILFPAKSLCPKCRHLSVGKLKPYKFKGTGTVETYTVVHSPPAGFEMQTPYVIALIKLDEGPTLTGQIVDVKPDAVQIGTRVKSTFRRIADEGEAGIIQYGYKFVPA
ncbi:MAG: Zn-ribbon domain-containing OB-fold protein [Methanobacteriota archaeon]